MKLAAVSADEVMTRLSRARLSQSGPQGDLLQTARQKIQSGQFKTVLLDICCEEDSKLSEQVPAQALAIRITKSEDLGQKTTLRAIHGIVRVCGQMGVYHCTCG